MRITIITAILLSACISIQNKKKLEINQDQCNVDKREDYYYPIHLKFSTSVRDGDPIEVSASTLAPCALVEEFVVEIVLNGIKTSMKFNSNTEEMNLALSRTEEMTMDQLAEWWNQFVPTFKYVVVGAKIEVLNNKATIEIMYMDPKVLMHLEGLKLPFTEGVYDYDIDAMLEAKRPKKQLQVQEMQMTPEILEMFKNQLMSKENMTQLMQQFKDNQSSTIETTNPQGNKIQIVLQRQIVDSSQDNKQNTKNFLI